MNDTIIINRETADIALVFLMNEKRRMEVQYFPLMESEKERLTALDNACDELARVLGGVTNDN